jgi:ATP-dependent Clp protease adapter protein ClpS
MIGNQLAVANFEQISLAFHILEDDERQTSQRLHMHFVALCSVMEFEISQCSHSHLTLAALWRQHYMTGS